MNLGVIAIVFGVIFISELPDKSMFASLILGMRYRSSYVWAGAAAAFLVHVLIAVTVGQAFTLLPHSVLEWIIAAMFLAGALLLFFGNHNLEDKSEEEKIAKLGKSHGFWKVFGTAFGVIFLGEWGDITQIATANYTAHYHAPLSVAVGAIAGLWLVAAIAVVSGTKLLKIIPAKTLQLVTACILLLFAIFSAYSAIHG